MIATVSEQSVDNGVPTPVWAMIEAAKQAPGEEKGRLLWATQSCAPSALPTYFLLYKFHMSRGEYGSAMRAARLGLQEAGRQAGLPTCIDGGGVYIPEGVSFAENGAARSWLFALRALVAATQRAGAQEQARAYLALLQRCDPDYSVSGVPPELQ